MSYFNDKTDKDLSVPGHGQGMPGTDARRRSYELNDKYTGKDNTPSEDNKPQEDYSLNDDRRVKVLSPGTLVAKRFFRNRLAVVGLTILAVMFIFSFVGGLVSPYGQDEVFYRDDIQMKEYAALSENTEYRYLVADGQEFGAVLQAQLTLYMGKEESFTYKGTTYTITEEGDSLYSVSQGNTLLAVAYKDIVNPSATGEKFSFTFTFNALKAHVNGETEFTAEGKTYALDDGSVMLNGEEIAYISRYVIQSKVAGTVISKEFKERVIEAAEKGETQVEYTNENGDVREIQLEYNPAKYQWSIKEGTSTRVFDAYSFPDSAHWLGTDKNGMDMLTRLMYGGRVSLMIGFIVVIISAALGVVLGGVSGYFGGWVDNLIILHPLHPAHHHSGRSDGRHARRPADPNALLNVDLGLPRLAGYRPSRPRPDPLSARAGVHDRDGGLRHQRFAPHLPPPDPQRHPAAHRQLHDEPRLHHHHRGNAQLPRPRRQVPVRLLGQHHERRFQLLRPHELLVHLDPRRHLPDADGPRLQLRRRRSARRVRPEDEALRKEGI